MSVFCTSCGKELSEAAKFCNRCGAPVEKQPPQEEVPASQPEAAVIPPAGEDAKPVSENVSPETPAAPAVPVIQAAQAARSGVFAAEKAVAPVINTDPVPEPDQKPEKKVRVLPIILFILIVLFLIFDCLVLFTDLIFKKPAASEKEEAYFPVTGIYEEV